MKPAGHAEYGSRGTFDNEALRNNVTDAIHRGHRFHARDVRRLSPVFSVRGPRVFLHRGIEVVCCESGRSRSRADIEDVDSVPPHGEEAVLKEVF